MPFLVKFVGLYGAKQPNSELGLYLRAAKHYATKLHDQVDLNIFKKKKTTT